MKKGQQSKRSLVFFIIGKENDFYFLKIQKAYINKQRNQWGDKYE